MEVHAMEDGLVKPVMMSPDFSDDSYEKNNNKCLTLPNILTFPLCGLFSFFTVQEQEEAVVLCCGKYATTMTTPGCHYWVCCGRDIRKVSKRKVSLDLPVTKVIDKVGNPIIISGILVYHIINTKKAVMDVENASMFIRDQAMAVVKQIVAQYPYEHTGEGKEHSLKSESAEIGEHFVSVLQPKVIIAGAKILSFQFNELSYAPEIAQGMLKRQQASAMVSARKIIVDGVVDIAYGAIQKFEARGITMTDSEKTKMATNILTVMCAEHDVQPTIKVG